jgi:hypothetical protein
MIFNKSNNGSDELLTATGSYYKSNDFARIEMEVELAQEEVAELIGSAVMERADIFYNGDNYQDDDEQYDVDNSLVKRLQACVGMLAAIRYYQAVDVSHEDSGRKVKIDSTNEKLPWEWMLEKDNAVQLRKYHRVTDLLIKYLELHEDDIEEWAESNAQKTARGLFISNAEMFDTIFPIDKSRAFYLRVLPFNKRVQEKYIKDILGTTVYDTLIEELQADNVSEDNAEMLTYVREAIPWKVMEMAIKSLSLQVIPEGVVQQFFSNLQTMKASQLGSIDMIAKVGNYFKLQSDEHLDNFKTYVMSLDPEESEETDDTDLLPTNDADNKYFRT